MNRNIFSIFAVVFFCSVFGVFFFVSRSGLQFFSQYFDSPVEIDNALVSRMIASWGNEAKNYSSIQKEAGENLYYLRVISNGRVKVTDEVLTKNPDSKVLLSLGGYIINNEKQVEEIYIPYLVEHDDGRLYAIGSGDITGRFTKQQVEDKLYGEIGIKKGVFISALYTGESIAKRHVLISKNPEYEQIYLLKNRPQWESLDGFFKRYEYQNISKQFLPLLIIIQKEKVI